MEYSEQSHKYKRFCDSEFAALLRIENDRNSQRKKRQPVEEVYVGHFDSPKVCGGCQKSDAGFGRGGYGPSRIESSSFEYQGIRLTCARDSLWISAFSSKASGKNLFLDIPTKASSKSRIWVSKQAFLSQRNLAWHPCADE